MNFGESLKGLMIEKNIDSNKLAGNLGVTRKSVDNWKNNRTEIALSYLVNLCHYFNCSLSYLIGKTDQNTIPGKFSIENFGTQVRTIMKRKGISTYKLEKETRFAGKYFNVWDKGSDPKLSMLIELANYFDCSLDELVGLE